MNIKYVRRTDGMDERTEIRENIIYTRNTNLLPAKENPLVLWNNQTK